MNKLFNTALFAAAALVAGVTASQAAPVSAGGYYQDQVLKDCSNASFCNIKFSAVPAGKTLIVENVGCAITSAQSLAAMSMTARANGVSVGRSAYPVPVYMSTSGGTKRYNVNSDVVYVAKAAEVPEITVSALAASAGFVVNCSISGELK